MRRLLLVRHAEAVHPHGFRDRERPLTPAGRAHAARIGAALAAMGESPDFVLVSDALRTRETLELSLAALASRADVRIEPSLYHAERHELMAALRRSPEQAGSVMLVGHNPAVSEFAALFASGGDRDALNRIALGFPPGGLAIFACDAENWPRLRWGGGALQQFLS